MALSPASKWTLVACGVVAHADGVLDGEECDRLMALIEEEASDDEYASWLATLSDPRKLGEILEGLAPPPAATHREILEQAWILSVVDGERSTSEIEALQRVADQLGVEPMQLEFWKEAWDQAQDAFAEAIARTLALVVGGDSPVPEADRRLVEEIIWRLPTSQELREELGVLAAVAQPAEQVVRALDAIPRRRRLWLFKLIAPAVASSATPDHAARRFIELATRVGIEADRAQRLLES